MQTVPPTWPDDVDGDVFRRMQESGFHFGDETDIDFNIDLDVWPPSDALLDLLRGQAFSSVRVCPPDETGSGYILVVVHAKLTYELVTAMQQALSDIAAPFGGWCDSWGVLQD